MKRSYRVIALLSAGVLFVTSGQASAGPNDGKVIATEGHIDSPKIFWENGGFALKSGSSKGILPIEETANWIGKGDTTSLQQYVYEVGEDPRLSFLGTPGDLLYWGPAVTQRGYPIWIGFGADIGIPVEQFRDESFQLDIVDFDGPGRMELFNASDADMPVTRLLSSHDEGRRSTWINPGLHTHNETTFTRPGQYTVTYRASARDKEGNLVASQPQTVAWQVGGTRPSSTGLGDVRAAFDEAPTGDASGYRFTAQPHDPEQGGADAEYLTDLSFTTGNGTDQGTAVFYIDGYYLAEVPVTNGQAEWSEMIGSQSSNFQVVYIPKDDGARWVSEPMSYDRTMGETSTETEGTFPVPDSQDPAPQFDQTEKVPTGMGVSISTEGYPDGENMVAITMQPEDDRLSFRVTGGYYSSADAEFEDCPVDFVSAPGGRTQVVSRDFCEDPGMVLKLTLTPDSSVIASRAEFAQEVPDSGEVEGQATFAAAPQALQPTTAEPTPTTTTSAPATTEPTVEPAPTTSTTASTSTSASATTEATTETTVEPSTTTTTSTTTSASSTAASTTEPTVKPAPGPTDEVLIHDGHVDLGPIQSDGNLVFSVGDDSGLYEPQRVNRDPEDVALVVKPHARHEIGKKLKVESFPFLEGTEGYAWLLPQSQQRGLVWPGFSTEHVPDLAADTPVFFDIEPVSAPAGGKWWAFLSGSLGGIQEMLASSDAPSSFQRSGRVHMHNNWMFTKPGVYQMKMRTRIGDDQSTQWKLVTFHVLDQGQTEVVDTTTEPTTSVTSSPTTTPTQPPTDDSRPTSEQAAPTPNNPKPGNPGPGKPPAGSSSNGSSGTVAAIAAGLAAVAVVPAVVKAVMSAKQGEGSSAIPKQKQYAAGEKAPAAQTAMKSENANNPGQPGKTEQAAPAKKMLAATGANSLYLLGLAMGLAGLGFGVLALGLRSRRS